MSAFIYFNATFCHAERRKDVNTSGIETAVYNIDAESLQNWMALFPVGSTFEVTTETIYEDM